MAPNGDGAAAVAAPKPDVAAVVEVAPNGDEAAAVPAPKPDVAAGVEAAPKPDVAAGVEAAPKGLALGAAAAVEAAPKEKPADPPLAPVPNENPAKER